MKLEKREIYKKLLQNIMKTKSISKSTKNILSEKGGRNICKKLETFGYIQYNHNAKKHFVVEVTDRGMELFNKLCDFNFKFSDKEIFK